ncbi:hypothetical protein ACFWIW_10765 [Amycolatopsis sp. NPDC058340]|uniref:hypothetical protein n=1 Tax=Amycolatopsis sp. NPDC058340 TaxID=3346453 RepID=UPI00364BA34F
MSAEHELPDREFWAAAEAEDDAAMTVGLNYDEDESEDDQIARYEQEHEALLNSPTSDRDPDDPEPEMW